jgi:hypothetical protein
MAWNGSKQSGHQRTDIGWPYLSDWNEHGGFYLAVTVANRGSTQIRSRPGFRIEDRVCDEIIYNG